jgi:hypothetical protein
MERVQLELNDEEAADLASVLDDVIGDLSPEIADTDNVAYRADLKRRRDHLRAIRAQLPGA